jgi:SAM-dependent methyltransferase
MSHPQQLDFVKRVRDLFPDKFNKVSVLEVGSLDINGSVRLFFTDCNYVGIDVGAGAGVDVVCEGQNYDAPDESFDTIISCECFEHNPYWIETFNNMIRMCKSSGLIIMTCATTGRPEHGTTKSSPDDSPLTVGRGWDYYRNLAESDFAQNFKLDDIFSVYRFSAQYTTCDLYFWGIKK